MKIQMNIFHFVPQQILTEINSFFSKPCLILFLNGLVDKLEYMAIEEFPQGT